MCKPPRYFEFIIPVTQSVSGLSPGMDPVFKVLNIGTYRTGQTSTSSESQVAFIYSRSLETKLRWRPWGRARRGSNGAARRRRADRRRNGTLLQRLGEHAQGGLQSPREPTQPTGASQRNLAHQTKPWLHSTGRRSKDLKHLSTKMLTVTLGSPSTVTFLGHTWKCRGRSCVQTRTAAYKGIWRFGILGNSVSQIKLRLRGISTVPYISPPGAFSARTPVIEPISSLARPFKRSRLRFLDLIFVAQAMATSSSIFAASFKAATTFASYAAAISFEKFSPRLNFNAPSLSPAQAGA